LDKSILKIVKSHYFDFVSAQSINFEIPRKSMMREHVPLEEGDYYLSEIGYKVFTKQYHLKRGYCCESGCKHCPYGYNKKTNRQE